MDFIIETLNGQNGRKTEKILTGILQPETIVKIPEGITTLDANVFNNLKDVEEVYFPASLIDCSKFRSLLFRDQKMVHVHIDNPMFSSHDGIVYNKEYTELLSCPMKKTDSYELLPTTISIAQQAFCGCNLSEIILNEGLKEIGEGAFCDSINLEEIRIPSSVEKIGDDAFYRMMAKNIPIVVGKGEYAESYAKRYYVPYRIEPEKSIDSWNEENWLNIFCRAKYAGDFSKIRTLRSEVFKNTLQCVTNGRYMTRLGHVVKLPLSEDVRRLSRFYFKEIFPQVSYTQRYKTQIAAVNCDCLEYATKVAAFEDDVCVLNMASRHNPGGGVVNGAGAQEEYLFRCSDYYRSLYQYANYAEQYGLKESKFQYPLNRNFGGIFSPNVTVFRSTEEDGYALLENPWKINFVAVPGMNRPATYVENGEERIIPQLIEGIENKIRTIFRIAIDNGMKTLLLGALGCGAFKNPPKHIAELFRKVLHEDEFMYVFRRVLFVIKEDHNSPKDGNFTPFEDIFGSIKPNDNLIPERNLIITPSFSDNASNRMTPISGKCLHSQWLGNSLKWELYSDGSLVIRGSGKIPDFVNHWNSYFGENQAPWIGCEKYGIMPHRLIIMDGITRIGANAFESFGCLKEISLPDSLKSIGEMAFFDCFNVTTVYLPKYFFMDMLTPAELPLEYNKEYVIDDGVMIKRDQRKNDKNFQFRGLLPKKFLH